MRIITGLLRGRKIEIPKNLDVRPTTDRVKEGLFSVIAARRFIQNCTILDLFAGSGNLGFEALSRGAQSVRFVDYSRHNIAHIEKLANEFEVSPQIRTVNLAVEHFLESPAIPYDIIFSDPPYKYSLIEQTVSTILSNGWLQPDGWLILEHNKYYDFSENLHCSQIKKYGRTYVSFFRAKPVNQEP